MTEELKNKLIYLADKYENTNFISKDPCQFIYHYKNPADIELSAFIAANLAFGRRDQIISHINLILKNIDETTRSPEKWILEKKYDDFFPQTDSSFYRMFTCNSMRLMFSTLRNFLTEDKTLGNHLHKIYSISQQQKTQLHFSQTICQLFPSECNIIPHTLNSSCKRMNLFLRWMVRNNSSVDTGLWNWFPKDQLLIPLDVHVLQEGVKLGLIKPTASGKIPAATIKMAYELTDQMKSIWPDDPVKADFALFGLGADTEKD